MKTECILCHFFIRPTIWQVFFDMLGVFGRFTTLEMPEWGNEIGKRRKKNLEKVLRNRQS